MTAMSRIAILSVLACLSCGVGAKAGIIYNIVDYSSLQDGYSIAGTITTDGTIGTAVDGSHITGWEITLSQAGAELVHFTQADSFQAPETSFSATATNLTIEDTGKLFFIADGAFVLWTESQSPGTYQAEVEGIGALWFTPWPAGNVVATTAVPEPSAIVLAASGAFAVFGCGWFRRRRKQRRLALAYRG